MTVPAKYQTFWASFLATLSQPEYANTKFYEAFAIGYDKESADDGASLILKGEKTSTSMLLWDVEVNHQPMYEVGSLHIVKDGSDQPVAVVETTELKVLPFNEVDEQFAYDYGEWDRTLAGWRKACWGFYSQQCQDLDKEASETMPLLCERFKVVFPLLQSLS